MRPTKLTMKAFGSYAEETTVRFGDLTGGLYLIVGKTGAGKTTIFDAISFALFGVPSGSDRKTEMLHSDFVPLSVDTAVTLEFVHQGREYRVERSLHFSKKRGSEGYRDATVSAVMSGPEQPAVEGATRVTARCEELLGLNSEQFRRIVMLAQGEFREFLKSGSERKNEILGRLFDNSEYVRFQNLLSAAARSLEQRRQACRAEIDTVMHGLFTLPQGLSEREAEDFLPAHPRLAENLQALVRREEAQLEALKDEHGRLSLEVQELTRREGAAETDNALLEELAGKRAFLASLEAQREAFAARREAYLAAEKALHRVKPREAEAERASALLTQTRQEIEKREALGAEQASALALARAAAEADGPKRLRADALAGEAAKLEAALPLYGQAAEKEAGMAGTRRKLEGAREAVGRLGDEQTALGEALAALREDLAALEGCEAAAARLSAELDAARERRDGAAAPGTGVSARVDAILGEEGALAAEAGKLKELTEKAAAAEERRHALYRAFLEGQAGLIAVSMEKELAETGKTVCPVCNTPFCREEAHRFALPADRVPDRTEVEAAEAAAKAAEDRRQKKQAELEKHRGLLEQRKEDAAAQARKLEPACSGWGVLVSPGWLPALCRRLEEALAEKERACAEAQASCRRRKKLLEDEKRKAAELEDLGTRLSEEKSRCEALERQLHGLDSAVQEIRRQLPFPAESEARGKLAALTQEREALLGEIGVHERALQAAKEALDRTSGGLKTLRDALPGQQEAAESA
ncbi:MAG: SMC family ATPase, partial [Oscillospiraceae bacterium]|nr:SMC family ATPase [Oscillospiraceae bacterium]